jgi:lysophospholipase L1-like esterase
MSMRIQCLGDSRTTFGGWQDLLIAGLNTATNAKPSHSYRTNTEAALDWSVMTLSSNATQYLADSSSSLAYPNIVLIDLGEHDMVNGSPPTQTAFQNAYLSLIDAIVAKWFDAEIYLDFPWTVALDGTSYTNFKGYIQNVIAARSMCHAGVDQGVTIKGSDNGATNTSDGIHFSTAGKIAYAAAMQTAMGY